MNELSAEEVLAHNQNVRTLIAQVEHDHALKIKQLKCCIIEPCDRCPYDGVYRCEACRDSNFEGFMIKDYPKQEG